jgi:hypothetical protein
MGWHMLAFVSNNASSMRESETAGESSLQKASSLEKTKPYEKEIRDLMFKVQTVFSLKRMKGSRFNVQLVNSQ